MELFNSLKGRLETYDEPFTHWAINKPLTDLAIKEICNAEIANPISEGINYDGTRAIDGGEGKFREGIKSGGKAKKYRCFVTKENSKNFPELTNFTKPGNFCILSFVIKHLNFMALPPEAMPSLNSGAPPSIALVPS